MTIGIPVHEFNEIKDLEITTFRREILNVCKETVELRKVDGDQSQALYAYPPDLESNPEPPPHIKVKLQKGAFLNTNRVEFYIISVVH